jgi:hypothetical protein
MWHGAAGCEDPHTAAVGALLLVHGHHGAGQWHGCVALAASPALPYSSGTRNRPGSIRQHDSRPHLARRCLNNETGSSRAVGRHQRRSYDILLFGSMSQPTTDSVKTAAPKI